MADDDDQSSLDKSKRLDDRLSYLELVARDTAARLYEIEKHLGLVFHAVPRDLKTASAAKPEDAHAADRALKPAKTASKLPAHQEPADAPIAKTISGDSPAGQPPSSLPQASDPSGEPGAGATLPRPPAPHAPLSRPAHSRSGEPSVPAAPAVWSARSTKGGNLRGGDLESRIGGNWFNRIGVLAIFLGVAFFLKYAVDNEWIGPTTRVLIGVAIGVLFLIGGERLRKRYASYAYGLTGGGIAVLYASIWFASSKRYGLISTTEAFAFMVVVTVTASLLAARYSALPIAVLGLIGGFLTPILLSTGVDNETGLFGYIAVLDAGVLLLAYSKQWRSLNYLSFIATILMFAAWMETWYDHTKLGTTIIFLSVFFVIFALLAVLYNVVKRRATGWPDLAMVFSNAVLYFGTSYALLDDEYHSRLGLFAVLVAAFYLGLGYFTYRRDREDKLLVFTFLGLGFLFSVLAVPIQFQQHWITMGWAVEGAVMTWIGLRANDRISRNGALVVFVIAITHWALSDVEQFAYLAPAHFVPLLNKRALSCAVLIASLVAAAFFYKRYGEKSEDRKSFGGMLLLAANALAVALLSLDANAYFEQRKALASGIDVANSLGNTKALTLTALWTMYGVGTLFIGVTRKIRPLRFLAILLLAGATVKVLVVDLNYYAASWHYLILNQTFASFGLIVAALVLGAWFYARNFEPDDPERDIMLPLLIGAANVLALIALSAEVWGHFTRIRFDTQGTDYVRLEHTKQFVLSVVWTIYGAVALFVGIKRATQAFRIGALLLLALTIAKVLVLDLSYYDDAWHTLILNQTFATFALLVYALASSARFYSGASSADRSAEKSADKSVDKEESKVMAPVLVAAANLLALVALSAEALGPFAAKISAGAVTPGPLGDLRLAQQLSLSVVWAIYGGAMLTIGIARRSKLLRVMALLLLGLTILKVFLLDLSSLEKLYRIISFIVLGAILLAVSFLYQRYRQRMVEFISDPNAESPVSSESN